MRAPYQVLALPYRQRGGEYEFCVFHRADNGQFQFVSGGGEDGETPEVSVVREIWEETGLKEARITRLTSMAYIPVNIFSPKYLDFWPKNTFVIPEYSFAYSCENEIVLSDEHTECFWLCYEKARELLTWDSNKAALFELNCRLHTDKSL